jgi:hypothetical protein
MRSDRPEEPTAAQCGGFRVVFEDGQPLVRPVPGDRQLAPGVTAAVLQGLAEAPELFAKVLGLRPPQRPYDRVEVAVDTGELTQGEAVSVGLGVIRLAVGEKTTPEDARRIARHEALHLLLAAGLPGGARWSKPDLAFAEWVVRGIEGGLDASIPRFRSPLPAILDPVPAARADVQRHLGAEDAPRYFGEPLYAALQRIDGEQRKLWLVEAALGTHYLERAGDLALRPILLDDWLIDYEQYARAVGNPPSGAGNLWRMSDAGWSRDPVTRLSVAAQALQCDDQFVFGGAAAAEPLVWKNRGRVRLPLMPAASSPRPAPIHGFRAVLREAGGDALALVEEAAQGGAQLFEARVLWPRILARLLAAKFPLPEGGEAPLVRPVDARADEWRQAAGVLQEWAGSWAPRVGSQQAASILLVHAAPLSAATLSRARQLALSQPVRGALFTSLERGAAYELVPDLEPPIDPRYREDAWIPGPVPSRVEDLPGLIDEATREGRLTTPLSYLLAIMAIGLEECHYPRANRAASS